jgi:hypothetical protein
VVARSDEGDERWRDVLFEMVRRAKGDAEFRARVEAAGAVLDNFEAVLERVRGSREVAASDVRCREYWWGFELEIPNRILAAWTTPELAEIRTAIGTVPGPVGPFTKRAAAFIAHRVDELRELDTGRGIHVSMTWMAPNVFVPIAIR